MKEKFYLKIQSTRPNYMNNFQSEMKQPSFFSSTQSKPQTSRQQEQAEPENIKLEENRLAFSF